MNTKTTNIAFIILIVLLAVASAKVQKTAVVQKTSPGAVSVFDFLNRNRGGNSQSDVDVETTETSDSQVYLTDFSDIEQSQKFDRSIDRATAYSYTNTRTLSNTELLELIKVSKLNPELNRNKKIIIYLNKPSSFETQSFVNDFVAVRQKYKTNRDFVFIPRETLWTLHDKNLKNTHDRVIYNLQKDCGDLCILDYKTKKITTLKGTRVGVKSAEIVDVVLQSLQ